MATAPLRRPTAPSARIRHVCTACGADSPKWQGRCPACGEWNTLEEAAGPEPSRLVAGRVRPSGAALAGIAARARPLDAVDGSEATRQSSGIPECDRVLGGGVVPGSLVLLGGDPGIGKSTLALQLARRFGEPLRPALYCTGEESAAQLAMRAERIGCASAEVAVLPETDLDVLLATIEAARPPLAVVDSIQTVYDTAVPGVPGSISQVREAVARLLLCAKATGVPVLVVGHVTKEGAIAGPRTLEHMVDVVLYLEGERHGDHRLLRGIKNRFGASGELGLFVMREGGMVEAEAPGRAFLDEGSLGVPGNAITVTCEGSRPLAVEVQALAAPTPFGLPRRTASGFDLGRLHLLLAVLEKRAGMPFGQADVYVNAVGGVRLNEPAADLAVALAIVSSVRDAPLPDGCAVLGEIGLGGEIRRVRRTEQRLQEAATLGIAAAVVPAGFTAKPPPGMRLHRVATLGDAVRLLS
ncbi:MAG TPA: DNA repair protein RadA [Candidatus Dormibacteraeota bacterium]|jgi:DNA repair protein RadA/Sms|nr:DNA repair protein RadA [Candidatus Dormibacteraeota bacterium]